MASKANIVLNDGHDPVVPRTFTPLQSKEDFESWVDRSTDVSIGQKQVIISIRRPQKNAPSNRVRLSIMLPTLESATPAASGFTPAPRVAYTHMANVDFICPDRGTLAERKDLIAFVQSATYTLALSDAILNAEMPY